MPVGLPDLPDLDPVPGIRLGVANAGISNKDREDLTLIECAPGTIAAGTFTRNRFCAAPVIVARDHLSENTVRALIINSGNANAGTGAEGVRNARQVCRFVADALGVPMGSVLPFSTGVIGQELHLPDFERGVTECVDGLDQGNWLKAARAIMTTDMVPKGLSRKLQVGESQICFTGIAKGSGMIRPNMATMLAFAAIDATIEAHLLNEIVSRAVESSFNRITVDGDTSTNDACLLLATGTAEMEPIEDKSDSRFTQLQQQVQEAFSELAQSLIRDGEGATKFVTVEVLGADSEEDAREIAFTVAHSPLVKTALFASDPNWGRILAAVGRANVAQMDIGRISIAINDLQIVSGGERSREYTEAAGQRAVEPDDITISIDLGSGPSGAIVWTSDLSYDYVKINAEYRS